MSFMSGIMMGAAIGRNIHDMVVMNKGKKKQVTSVAAGKAVPVADASVEEFALVFAMPGRRRYRMAALVNNAALAVLLEKQLQRVNYVYEAKANPATGSLLISFEGHEAEMDKLAVGLRQIVVRGNGMEEQAGAKCQEAKEKHLPPTLYARSWRGTGSFMNTQVRSLTSGWFDISTLLSLFFLLRGIRRMLIYGDRPNGSAMIWWALHLMKGWKG